MMDMIKLFFILFGMSIVTLWLGISTYKGYRRYDYIYPHYYSGGAYASIPFGVAFLMWAFIFPMPFPQNLGLFLTGVSFVPAMIGLVFNFTQPEFMQPEWYRWLKEKHSDIMPYLYQDARELGYRPWMARTKTQERLEAWVADVKQKHGSS